MIDNSEYDRRHLRVSERRRLCTIHSERSISVADNGKTNSSRGSNKDERVRQKSQRDVNIVMTENTVNAGRLSFDHKFNKVSVAAWGGRTSSLNA